MEASAPITCISFDFDNCLVLSERAKRSALEEIAGSFQNGLEVLSTIHTDSRSAPPGFSVSRDQIFRDFCAGLHERGLPLEPSPGCALLRAFQQAEGENGAAATTTSTAFSAGKRTAAAENQEQEKEKKGLVTPAAASVEDQGQARRDDDDRMVYELSRWLVDVYTERVHRLLSCRASEMHGASALLEALAARGTLCLFM